MYNPETVGISQYPAKLNLAWKSCFQLLFHEDSLFPSLVHVKQNKKTKPYLA